MAIPNRIKKLLGLGRRAQTPPDVWAMIERHLTYSIREQRRARRWRIFFRLMYVILFIAILMLIGRCQQTAGYSYEKLYDKQVDHLALIRVQGIIADEGGRSSGGFLVSAEGINDSLRRAFANKKVKAIFLAINSPGGSPVQSGQIFDELMRLRAQHPDKKVYAVVKELGASAAYHIAAGADEIHADDSSLVGSIGIISGGFGYEGALEKLGLERRLYTAGENKAFLDPFSPADAEHEQFWQEVLDRLHAHFIADVRRGRGPRLADDPAIFSGYLYDGERALELGLVDGLGDLRSVALAKTNLDNMVDYSPSIAPWEDWLDLRVDNAVERLFNQFLQPALQ